MAIGRAVAALLIQGGAIFASAFFQAYRQAQKNGQAAGLGQQTFKQMTRGRQISLHESQLVLGVENSTSLEEVYKKYVHLLEVNKKQGSFYLESKVFRAWERINMERGPISEDIINKYKPVEELPQGDEAPGGNGANAQQQQTTDAR